MEDKKKTIDGQVYWHYTLLSNWRKNEDYRIIKEKGWLRLLKSVKKSGIKTPFEIDEEGTIYDGNNRFRGILELISEGIIEAENGKSIEWIKVNINPTPQSDTEALKIAAIGNGDKDFAMWNKDAVANHKEEFEAIEGFEDLVFDMDEAMTFSDTFEAFDDEVAEEPKEKKGACEDCKAYHERNHTQNIPEQA